MRERKPSATQTTVCNTEAETRVDDIESSARTATQTTGHVGNNILLGNGNIRLKRQAKIKFLGREISHLWDDSWYTGTVMSLKSGQDGHTSAVYNIHYDDDNAEYEVDNLLQDYMNGEVKFIDI